MAKKTPPTPDTVITITLPGEGGIQRTGTMLVQRGSLAQIRTFNYCNLADIAHAIEAATQGILDIEANPPPVIKTTDADVYKPDLEAKRKQLNPGVMVKTSDGHEGEILADDDEDIWPVDIGRENGVFGYYGLEDLTPVQRSRESVDPATVKGQKPLPQTRPATDISPVGEKAAQLSLF